MAAGVSLNKNISSVWQKILTVVNNALVFMDNPAAEMLHWSGKVKNVFEAGALAVYDLSSRRSGNESETKAVFIVTSVIHGQILDDISAIVQSSDFQHCTILCTVPEYVNAFAKHTNAMEVSVFGELSLKLREWMGNPYSTVDIHHVPLFASQICPGLFFTPSFSTFFPIMPSDIARLQGFLRSTGDKGKLFNSLSDIDMSDLPHNLQVKIKMFAASLSSMFELMDINEDCYGMGYLSKLIANELANLPAARGRRKTANGRASLVLIDRTLDLAGPCSHSGDTIADKIIALLPRLPYHQVDVAVDMSSVCARGSVTPDTVAPGCLSHANDKVSQVLLNSLFTKKQKEGLVDLSRSLTHALNKESLDISSQPTKVTLESIQVALDHFRGQPKAFQNNSPLLQITMAAISALQHKDISHFQRLLGKEKGLFLSLGEDDPQSIINDLISCLESDKNKEFSCIEDILLVLCYLYSLVGDIFMESPAELERLKNVMVDCLLSGKLTCGNKDFLDDEIVEKTARRKVADAFEKLLGIGQARDEMKQFQNVYQDATALKEAFYQPLIKQALDAIFDKDKPELVDIEFKSHGLKDYIKTGFSLFMNVSKPRPSDLPLLVVFVIGGISSTEIKQIRDALATYRTNTQVLIGSTQVIKPADVFQKVFCQDNLFPSLV